MQARRVVLGLVLAASLSGCTTQPWMFQDWPSSAPPLPTRAPASDTPTPSAPPTQSASLTPSIDPERARYPYQGTLTSETCVNATRDLLDQLESVEPTPGAVSYPRGALVQSDPPWWTVAVDTRVNPDQPGAPKDVPSVEWYVTNSPSVPAGSVVSTWPLKPAADDAAADRALTCLGVAPPAPPDFPEDSPASYTGRLAVGATCTAAPAELLKHLEAVGRVGGAITYPRGQMIAANKKWWTVAIATEVHPNKLGHTKDNVPPVVYFATNVPSKGTAGKSFALDSVTGDSAAAAAKNCMGG